MYVSAKREVVCLQVSVHGNLDELDILNLSWHFEMRHKDESVLHLSSGGRLSSYHVFGTCFGQLIVKLYAQFAASFMVRRQIRCTFGSLCDILEPQEDVEK